MKKCPTCNRTFTDDALSFCLQDGSPLLSVDAGAGSSSYNPAATMQYNPARDTNPPPPAYPPPQYQQSQVPPPAWTPMPGAGAAQGKQAAKKSKAAYWILGILVLLAVLVVGGAGLVYFLVGMSNSNRNNSNVANANTNSNSNTNTNSNSNANANTSSDKAYVAQDDFSSVKWWEGTNEFGTGKYVNGEYQLSGVLDRNYVVVYGPRTYETKDATTRITARSVESTSPPDGYGLVVFGQLKDGQLQDYAFIITSGTNPNYRVYQHSAGQETTIISPTSSSLIRSGTSPNQLEVRSKDNQLTFYINGQYATSITDSAGFSSGAAGFYTTHTSPVAFDDLEIYK